MAVKKLRTVLRWTWRIFLVLLVALVVFILEENIRGRIMLARYKAKLHSKGEKLTLAELNIPKPAPESGAAQALFASAGELTNLSQVFVHLALEFSCRPRFIGPGCCVVRHLQADTDIRVPPPPGTRREAGTYYVCTWDELAEKVAFARGPLHAADKALREPDAGFSIDYGLGRKAGTREVEAAHAIAAWSSAATLCDLHERNLGVASQDLVTIIDLIRFLQGDRLLQWMRAYIGQQGLDATWEALQSPGWEDQQLAKLQLAWERASVLNQYEAYVEVHRAMELDEWDKVAHKPMRELLGWSDMSLNSWDDDLRFLLGAVWYLAWREQDEARGIRLWVKGVDDVRLALKEPRWTLAQEQFKRTEREEWEIRSGVYNRWRYQMSVPCWAFTWGPEDLKYFVQRMLEYETFREMTIAAIALKRFELRHGKPPTDLAALVPEFLERMPHDYMDGNDLRYRLNADSTWTLYSVGEDGVDNGGDPTIASPGLASRMWWGRDAVWPVAATPEEVEAWESLRMQRAQQGGPPRARTQR